MDERIIEILIEAIDALGDIPDAVATEQQKRAYVMCVEELKRQNGLLTSSKG